MSGNVPAISETNLTRIIRGIRDLFEGRSNAMGSFTCALSAATTTVSHVNIGLESKIMLMARHANAAAEVGNGTIYIATAGITAGQFVVTHANSATANRTFDFIIQG